MKSYIDLALSPWVALTNKFVSVPGAPPLTNEFVSATRSCRSLARNFGNFQTQFTRPDRWRAPKSSFRGRSPGGVYQGLGPLSPAAIQAENRVAIVVPSRTSRR